MLTRMVLSLSFLKTRKRFASPQILVIVQKSYTLHFLLIKSESFKNVIDIDLSLIYHLFKKLSLNLNYLATKKKRSFVPYGMTLTITPKSLC